ncbi:MAG: GNAT family N-acetyltransferase [Steroidobacterales bacterium]
MDVRAAEEAEVGHLAKLWFDGWQDAHLKIVPAELARLRTLESLASRMQVALSRVRVAGPRGAPVGFHLIKADELYQFYVSAQARGTGIAAILIADAETRLREAGVETAWLGCAIGNDRAARFYEKCGWHRIGTVIERLETSSGEFPLEVWRYEKALAPARA